MAFQLQFAPAESFRRLVLSYQGGCLRSIAKLLSESGTLPLDHLRAIDH